MKSDNYKISHMTSHMMNLIWLGQFDIIAYLKVDFSLIIYYLIYLIFSINLFDQPFKSIFLINLLN